MINLYNLSFEMNMEQVASVQRAMEEGVAEIKRVEQGKSAI